MNIKNNVLFRKKEFLYFCIQRLCFGFSYSLMIPIIPLYFNSIGISTSIIGVVMSAYGLAKALIQIPLGLFVNKIGDKLLLIISFGLMAVVPFLYTITDNSIIASGIYILQGAILGMSAPATFALLARSLDEKKRGQCTGYASAVFTLSGSIASIIGGGIVTKLNNYNLVFYMSSIGVILTIIFIFIKLKKAEVNESVKKKKRSIKLSINEIIKTIKEEKLAIKIFVLGIIALLGDFIYGCIVSMFPFYGQDVLGRTAFYTSVIISVYLFVFGIFAPIGGWCSDKIGIKKQLLISFIIMNVSLAILSFTKAIVIFTITITMYFLGATFLNAALQNSLLKFGEDKKVEGIVFGFVGACEALGYAIGPIIASYVYNLNKVWLFPGLFIFTVLVFCIFIVLQKKAFSIKNS